jgi:uncharacterized membrane protein
MEPTDPIIDHVGADADAYRPLFAWDGFRNMRINVSEAERWASAALGGGLVAYGLRKRRWTGALFVLAGGVLLVRGALGRSLFYRFLGVNSATGEGMPGQEKIANLIRIDKSIAVSRSAEEVYRQIRELENLPALFGHLKSVEPLSGSRSRWTARMPAGADLAWDTELTEDRPNRKLAWRSGEEAAVRSEGAIVLDPLPGSRTQIGVHLEYALPAGKTGRLFAKLFGKHPDRLLDEELHRFKSRLETGS